MAASAPRSYRIHWPSPCADQRVARLLSSVFCGTLPSFALARADATGSGGRAGGAVRWIGMFVVLLELLRLFSRARVRTTLVAGAGLKMLSRLESLNLLL